MPRSLFIALVTLFVLALVGMAVWFFFFYEAPQRELDTSPTVSDFLPFGKLREGPGPETSGPGGSAGQALVSGQRSFGSLTRLVAAPVAGFAVNGTTSVRYMERGTGHVYDVALASGKGERVTNTTIPRVYEALFAEGGALVVVRYLRDDNETIETYSAKIEKGGSGEATELKGIFLPPNIKDLVVSPDGKKIFYLAAFAGGAAGFTAAPDNAGKVQVWSSPANEWLAGWGSERALVAATKPSGGVLGFAYLIDPVRKTAEKLLGGVPGLTALMAPDGNLVLYGRSDGPTPGLGIYRAKEGVAAVVGLASFPEKCVWKKDGTKAYCAVPEQLPAGRYPDAWYQGRVLFSDRIWEIDALSGDTTFLETLRELSGERVDAVKPALSSDGKILFFINKKDQSLWSLKLEGESQ
ncbi:MAG: hypothetical protein Q8Q36_01250 [bacterium]|nr:hypothetical protein [bacterium]